MLNKSISGNSDLLMFSLLGVKWYLMWLKFTALLRLRWNQTKLVDRNVESEALGQTPSGHKILDYQHITWKVHSTPQNEIAAVTESIFELVFEVKFGKVDDG